MEKMDLLKKVGIIVAAVVVLLALILLLTFVIGGPTRALSSKELAQQHTRIALEIEIRQTAQAKTSTAELYLTLGVPMPTETPFLIPTEGALGRETRTPAGTAIGGGTLMPPGVDQPTIPVSPPVNQLTRTSTIPLLPGQPTFTPSATTKPAGTATQATDWGGEWSAWLADASGNYQKGTMSLTLNGSSLQGKAQFPGDTLTLSGKMEEDMLVYGKYTSLTGSGPFFWYPQEPYKVFIGNLSFNERGFCAARPGAEMPDPCHMNSIQ